MANCSRYEVLARSFSTIREAGQRKPVRLLLERIRKDDVQPKRLVATKPAAVTNALQLDDPRHGFLLRASAENVLTSFQAMRVDAASFAVAGDTTGLPALAPNDQLRFDILAADDTDDIFQEAHADIAVD